MGNGVRTIDAGIVVEDMITGYTVSDYEVKRNSFKNLQHGINIMNEFDVYPSTVKHAQFENCLRGIRNEGVDLCTFVGNDFTIGGNPALVTPVNGQIQLPIDEGIILHGEMAGFTIEQNTFAGLTNATHITVGIRTDGTGETNNRIYNNTLNGLLIGNLGNRQNRNGNQTIYTGLSYECNNNSNNQFYDFSVTEPDMNDPQYLQTGVRRNQGLISLAAGDKFTAFSSGEGHFGDETGKDIFYYYGNNIDNPAPVYTTANVRYNLATGNNTCASNFSFTTVGDPPGGGLSGLTLPDYTSAFTSLRAAYNQYSGKLLSLIDGGNTQYRMKQVDTMANLNHLKDTLMSYAPNLSSSVLVRVAKRTSLTTERQYPVLKANAEGVDNNVMKIWIDANNPSQWMVDSINAARYNLTSRSYLLDTVLYYSAEKDYALHNALRLIAEDTAGFNLSLYRTWLDSADNAWAKRKKVNTYIYEGKLDTITTMLAHLDTTLTATTADSLSFKNYKDFTLAYKNWMETDTFLNRLDSAHRGDLKTLAGLNEHSKGSQMARNVLNFFYDSVYFTPPMLPEMGYGKKGEEAVMPVEKAKLVAEQKTSLPTIKLYPNPAQNKVTIEYAGINETSKLYVVNTLGMIIESLGLNETQGKYELNTSSYQNGIYLIRIEADGSSLIKDKFIILK